jgi:N-acetylmuramoyl-L-alanine amidase
MRPAATLLLLATTLGLVAAAAEPAATRLGNVDYVNLDEAAAYLGLRVEHLGTQAVLLKDGPQPVARLAEHSREIDVKGLRLFLGSVVLEHRGVYYVSETDYRVRLVPRLRPERVRPMREPPKVIVIDPGHGGVDHGTENRTLGVMEKTCTLDVALKLKRLLEASGYKVVLTRESDVDVPLAARALIANRAGADLFVSIHFNSLYPNTKTTGAEVFSFSPRAQRSTDSWSLGGKDDAEASLAPVNAFDSWNTILAGAVHRRILDALRDGDRGEKIAHFGALRELRCPGILVESAIITSDKEGALLKTPEFRDKIAAAVFQGIEDYCAMMGGRDPKVQAAPAAAAAAPSAPLARSAPTRPSGP